MGIDLRLFMDESESLIDLEDRLKNSGRELPNYRNYIKWLDDRWGQISAKRIAQVLESNPTESNFPTLTVESGGLEYQLHGIVHGWPAYSAPGWHPRRNIRDYVSATADSFHRPLNGEDYLYEENLHISFDLLRSQELKDQTNTNGTSGSALKDIGLKALFIPVGMLAVITIPAISGLAYVLSKTIKEPKGEFQGLLYLGQRALTDERYQSKFADFHIAAEMPQPFNLEKVYLSEKGSDVSKLVDSLSIEPNAATAEERSLWTAKELLDYASRRAIKKLHYICGCGHTTEIAYFLKHPDYSFERLEEYRQRRK